jgi:hypothetical protein
VPADDDETAGGSSISLQTIQAMGGSAVPTCGWPGQLLISWSTEQVVAPWERDDSLAKVAERGRVYIIFFANVWCINMSNLRETVTCVTVFIDQNNKGANNKQLAT